MSSHVYCTGDMIAEECPGQPGAVDFMTEYHSEVYSFMADIIGCDIDRPGKITYSNVCAEICAENN